MSAQEAQGGTDAVSVPPTADRPATARLAANAANLRPRRTPAWVARAVKATRIADVAVEQLRKVGGSVHDLVDLPEVGKERLRVLADVKRATDGSAISAETWDTVLTLVAGRLAVPEPSPVCDRPHCLGHGRRHAPGRHVSAGLVE